MNATARKRRAIAPIVGWPLVGVSSLILVTLVVAILELYGVGETGLRLVIRTTARTSLVLFTGAFIASAVNRLWPTWLSRWLRSNRRYLGVSFAVSHFLHLLAIIALVRAAPQFTPGGGTLIGGGLAYVFIAAMTATSFDRTAAWLGPRAWGVLHTVGLYYVWVIFFVSYAPRAAQSPFYAPFAFVLLAALALRIAGRRRNRNPAEKRRPARRQSASGTAASLG